MEQKSKPTDSEWKAFKAGEIAYNEARQFYENPYKDDRNLAWWWECGWTRMKAYRTGITH